MVRTKADAATRVAAGGKAPKKTANRSRNSPSLSPTEKLGKDNLPVNRYCPRETPAWQKKITFFIDKSEKTEKVAESNELSKNNLMPEENGSGRSKRKSSELDESDEMATDDIEVATKKIRTQDMETCEDEEDGNKSMAVDE